MPEREGRTGGYEDREVREGVSYEALWPRRVASTILLGLHQLWSSPGPEWLTGELRVGTQDPGLPAGTLDPEVAGLVVGTGLVLWG